MPEAGGVSVAPKGLVFDGTVTTVVSATEFMVAGLAGFGNAFFNSWSAYVVRKDNGTGLAPQGEGPMVITYTSSNGDFTTTAYTTGLSIGDEIYFLHPSFFVFGLQLGKLQGLTPVSGSIVANWQAAEQNLVTIGAAGTRNKVHSLVVGIQNLVGNITIRLYMNVNGVERWIFPPKTTTWNVAAGDSPGVAVINGTIGVHEAIRVTVRSDNVADNGAAVTYDAFLEAM